jgi:hypothetical protein
MILQYTNKSDEFLDLLDIISNCKNEDFYLTENNQRIFIKDSETLKKLLSETEICFFENTPINQGIILIWRSHGGDKVRYYIKLIANNEETTRGLLTMLFWNFDKNIFLKIKKDSKFLHIFKEKGFKFIGGRGSEILLTRNKFTRE